MSTKNIIKNIIFFIINKYMKKSHYNILLGTLIITAIIFIISVILKLVANYKKNIKEPYTQKSLLKDYPYM
jgi:hypothetical protein